MFGDLSAVGLQITPAPAGDGTGACRDGTVVILCTEEWRIVRYITLAGVQNALSRGLTGATRLRFFPRSWRVGLLEYVRGI